MNTCFFMGHRDAEDKLLPRLRDAVERHITECGVTDFVVGGYGRFDALAAQAVIDAKKKHPTVSLTLLLPYHPAERPVFPPEGFDNTFYPPGMEKVPRLFAISRANWYMVDNCSHLIACVWVPGHLRDLLEHAQKRERRGDLNITMVGNENP